MIKREMSGKAMLLMSFAAFGIQFGSALQAANMSSIYKYLGANVSNIAFLWIGAPLIGLLAQPIIGFMSDRSWFRFLPGKFGRRQPYILMYGILGCISLFLMPNSSCLLMAFVLMWVLDLSNNGATEPYRAMIGDVAPKKQMTKAFAIYTVLASLGASLAALLPWIMINVFGLTGESAGSDIPLSIKLAFYIGSFSFIFFTCITIFSTQEYPPEDMDAFLAEKRELRKINPFVRFGRATKEICYKVTHMPPVLMDFWIPQLFIWCALFCFWVYFGIGIAQNVYGLPPGAVVKGNALFSTELMKGAAWCGVCFATYQIVSFISSFFLPAIAKRTGGKAAYGLTLIAGSIGMLSAYFIHNSFFMVLCMIGVGITWAGIMTMPYSIIAHEISQEELGVYMGLFNITICIPQIICSLTLGIIAKDIFHNRAMDIVFLGGILMFIGALLMIRLQFRDNKRAKKTEVPAG